MYSIVRQIETNTEKALPKFGNGWIVCKRSTMQKRPRQKALYYTVISNMSTGPRNAYISFNESHEMTIQMLQIS